MPLPEEDKKSGENDAALSLIRQKVANLYTEEPSAEAEEKEIEATGIHSKHQEFMQKLVNSGKSLAEIQTAWHIYYQKLPDTEKREVWQEFYANNPKTVNYFKNHRPGKTHTEQTTPKPKPTVSPKEWFAKDTITDTSKSTSNTKDKVIKKVSSRSRLKAKHHFQSLAFGLGMGLLVVLVVMFSFFNERFVAPFITPSKVASSSPMILDPNSSGTVDPAPKIIIPKINVEIPVIYDTPSNQEKDIQASLEKGAVYYPGTAVPGQNGNVVLVGHSSSNIFNRGKYKFAFVLLNKLEVNDTFLLNYNGKRYVYKIYSKKIVKPTETSVLGTADKPATATLITCDPPGTNVNRLVLLAEQISPSVNSNTIANTNVTNTDQVAVVPGNSQSLFSRLFGWLFD